MIDIKFSVLIKALADETRLRIINLLFQKELCVCEIENTLNMSEPRISRHLKILKNSNIILARKEGKWIHYSINNGKKLKHLLIFLKENFTEKKYIEDINKLRNNNISCNY